MSPKNRALEQRLIKRTIHMTYKLARRITIGVVGITVILLGAIMIVAPGPAFLVIPIGLAILSLEFAWAKLWLRRLRRAISNNNLNSRARRAEQHRDFSA